MTHSCTHVSVMIAGEHSMRYSALLKGNPPLPKGLPPFVALALRNLDVVRKPASSMDSQITLSHYLMCKLWQLLYMCNV